MARTFGGTASDVVDTGFTGTDLLRTYSGWALRTGDGGNGFGRLFSAGTAELELFVNNSTNDTYDYRRSWNDATFSIQRPTANVWHHIAIAYDGSSVNNVPSIYVDAVPQAVTTAVFPTGSFLTIDSSYLIGNRLDGLRNWAGAIGEFAAWGGILLSDAEIYALFTGEAAPLDLWRDLLIMYPPLPGLSSPEIDLATGKTSATVTGTVPADHPPISLITRPRRSLSSSGAPVFSQQYGGQAA
jgi:hypothetical protein